MKGRCGVVLIHGFTGTRREMEGLGRSLVENGFETRNVLLPGHETTPEDLRRKTREYWVKSIRTDVEEFVTNLEGYFYAGLSLGGLISLYLASDGYQSNTALRGIATLGSPLVLNDWRLKFVRLLKYVAGW